MARYIDPKLNKGYISQIVFFQVLNLVSYFVNRDEAKILNYFTFREQKWKYLHFFWLQGIFEMIPKVSSPSFFRPQETTNMISLPPTLLFQNIVFLN
jgi:hypothetical protein